ncbi:adventurous gliding motility protein GltJ [Archangium gephyra]|uniref:adventurous gliding motility protein GltJ n=1 Tax=Archangium gephyra TaxID=48 RepID=UPI0035D4A84B
MRFVCDSCRAQYMISDDKVGAKGVKVRCKKCGYNIVVRPAGSEPVKEEGTGGEAAGGAAASQGQQANDGFGLPPTLGTPPEGGIFSGVEDDELGAVFDQVLNSGSHRIPAGEASGPAQLDSSALSDAGETVRKLAEAEGNARSAASHEWFVAIDEKQVGPLSMDKVKDYWDRGEVGPDSLCWRAGFSDWIPLSEASELASVLAPRPTKPVIVEPAPMASSAPVASGPVESAFASGLAKPAKSDTPAPVGPSAQDTGWKPSAASVLASLVKEENEALSKPASKAAPAEEKKVKPAASGLLDVPPPESAPVAAPSPMMAEPPAPAPYLQPAPAPAYAQPPPQAYAQPMAPQYAPQAHQPQYAPPQGYPGYPPQAAPPPKQGGKMGMIIGAVAAVLLLVGGGAFFATRSSEQPAPVTPLAATQQVAQAPSKPAELPPMPPPPAAVAQNTATPAAGTAQPATAPTTAPAVAAAGTPGATPTAAPVTPPPAEQVKPAEPVKTEPQQVAKAEVPAKRTPTSTTRPPPSRTTSDDEEPVVRSKPQPAKSGGSADDEFDELFGTKKPSSSKSDTVSANGRTAYIPPEPGGGGASQEKLGQSDIMQVVLANKPAIIKCVNEQKKKDPGLSGKLVMRWTIQTNGKTKNVSCQTSEFRTTYMATCISGLIKGWSFPKHKVQGDPIDFPFTF